MHVLGSGGRYFNLTYIYIYVYVYIYICLYRNIYINHYFLWFLSGPGTGHPELVAEAEMLGLMLSGVQG